MVMLGWEGSDFWMVETLSLKKETKSLARVEGESWEGRMGSELLRSSLSAVMSYSYLVQCCALLCNGVVCCGCAMVVLCCAVLHGWGCDEMCCGCAVPCCAVLGLCCAVVVLCQKILVWMNEHNFLLG